MKEQTALDIARRMAELGEHGHAVTAYTLALADAQDCQPDTELEAALYILEHGGNYKVCLLYTSPSPRDRQKSRMPSSA